MRRSSLAGIFSFRPRPYSGKLRKLIKASQGKGPRFFESVPPWRRAMSKYPRLAILLVLAVSLFCISTLAQQAPPSADTFVSSSTPNTNYGPSIFLAVGSGTTAYLKFNLSDVAPGPAVAKATLRLFVDAVVTNGQFDVYNLPSTPTWSESALTYRTP